MARRGKKKMPDEEDRPPAISDDDVEVYIVKIYRRSNNPAQRLVGTIEDVRGQRKGKFKSAGQLIRCLTHPEEMQ